MSRSTLAVSADIGKCISASCTEGREGKRVEIDKGYKGRDRGAYCKIMTEGMILKGHEGKEGGKRLGIMARA